eukprot:c5494_g1_i1 orf=172-1143(+)
MASAGVPLQIDPTQPGHTLPDAGHAAPSKPPKTHLHHHDDVWNEEATLALLQSWGGKFLELNHGCLSRADWSHVTQQVILLSGKTSLTETQCRNRIDTLKKKFKREKHKLATMAGGCSTWSYFQHMDAIINPPPLQPAPKPLPPQPVVAPPANNVGKMDPCMEKREDFAQDTLKNVLLGSAVLGNENHTHDAANIVSASCEPPDTSEMSQSSLNVSDNERKDRHKAKRQRIENASFRVLAKALTKFAGVYEKIETTKQQQVLDLEKARMEITRNFELQKWQLLLQTQMELAKIRGGTDDVHVFVDDMSANLFATCFMPVEYCL